MTKTVSTVLMLGGMLVWWLFCTAAEASLVQFQFNGTGGGENVQALLGIDSSLVMPNGTFTQANLLSFSVQVTGAVTGSTTAIPVSLSGQFNNTANVFSSLFSNSPLTIPSYTGTNNFQFFGAYGESFQFAGSGSATPPAPPFNFVSTGTWSLTPVPVPAAFWLFGSGIAAAVGFSRRESVSSRAVSH
ncbi:hypothetical protein W02_37980 [Nitrospira sp. KM1]|uniref:hypothetical protein n=1 Tax=Nitrospira sp. KM1 TaxID=1936990 RepID=UPI0013A757BD|nr:hypothetical protein [Nitrospira sp. KM1]BCA56658.1 hypothetical protein W02_37980 [Nitrospira sp. KM1]